MTPDVTSLLETASLPALLAAAFAGGLVLSATPCVYPMIPVTVAAFGGQRTSRVRAAGLALLYVAGIALTYAALGVWAAATGHLLGAALADPRVTGAFAALFMALGAMSMGWLPGVEGLLSRTPAWVARVGNASPTGAFAMGLVAGVLFAPCVGPFVVGVLAHVAATGDVVLGGDTARLGGTRHGHALHRAGNRLGRIGSLAASRHAAQAGTLCPWFGLADGGSLLHEPQCLTALLPRDRDRRPSRSCD